MGLFWVYKDSELGALAPVEADPFQSPPNQKFDSKDEKFTDFTRAGSRNQKAASRRLLTTSCGLQQPMIRGAYVEP